MAWHQYRIGRGLVLLATACLASARASGQCQNQRWTGEFAVGAAGLIRSGVSPLVAALCVYDPDDAGPLPAHLYVGGGFDGAPGVASPCLLRWDGHAWSNVGGVLTSISTLAVTGLAVHDPDGDGPLLPLLVAAGRFQTAGGVPVANVAAWDGQSWSAMGSLPATSSNVSMVEFDEDGPGPLPRQLYLANGFTMWRWDGVQWTSFPTPQDPRVTALA